MSQKPPETVQMLNCRRGCKEVIALMLSEEKLNVLSTNERETRHRKRAMQSEASEFKMRRHEADRKASEKTERKKE